jgi:hypothetical protein
MDVIDDLKARARILHRQAKAHEQPALARLRALKELRGQGDEALVSEVKRRHCLAIVTRELGFEGWSHAVSVLKGGKVDDFGSLLCPLECSAHQNIWSASYEEARSIREQTAGYLLAYRRHFLVVDRYYIETLGLDPDHPDWDRIGRDWVQPAQPEARRRLYTELIQRREAQRQTRAQTKPLAMT